MSCLKFIVLAVFFMAAMQFINAEPDPTFYGGYGSGSFESMEYYPMMYGGYGMRYPYYPMGGHYYGKK